MTRFLFVLLIAALACGGSDPIQPQPQPPTSGDPSADLVATVTGPSVGGVGGDLVFQLRLRNLGPDAAETVLARTEFSGPVELIQASDGGVSSGSTVTWPAISTLSSGSEETFSVTVRPTATGDLSARASAESSTDDPDLTNNDGSAPDANATTTASIIADLRVLTDAGGTAVGGEESTIRVTTINGGPSTAADVQLGIQLPDDMTVRAISDGGSVDGGLVTWPVDVSVAAGDSVAHTVDVTMPLVGPFTSTATVQSGSNDPTVSNNAVSINTIVVATYLQTINGQFTGGQFGWEVEAVGDIDSDGAADYAVSAPTATAGGASAGQVTVHSGATGTVLFTFNGQPGDVLGIDMDAGEDYDNDGLPDLVVGASGSGPGRAVVYSLADGSVIRELAGEVAGDQFGFNAGRAGDVNGDGTPDLVVGALTGAGGLGRVYVYSGADWSLLWSADGPSQGSQFGHAARGVGDLDQDGFGDVAVGAPSAGGSGSGMVFILSGATGTDLMTPISADATGSQLGSFWISSPGDFNGDGTNDIYAADITNGALGSGTGRSYVYSGTDGTNLLTMTGEGSGDNFGIGHPAGDLDQDGVPDLVVAAWLSSEGGSQAGKVYLISGADGSYLRTITATTPNENFGFDAFVVGDLTGDAVPDLVVSAGISSNTAGHIHVIEGIAP